MYLISEVNFVRELSIPNLSSSQSGNLELLHLYADEKPRLLLQHCLGFELFNELDSQITNGVLNEDADQKWVNLVYGCVYDNKKWKGLLFQEGSFNTSVLAYFTYWNWLNDLYSSNLQIQVKNAENVNPTSSQVAVWNKFIEMYQGCFSNNYMLGNKFNNLQTICYSDFKRDYFHANKSNYVSLIQFLEENKEDYPNANLYIFENSSNSNSLGL
jgi:hypothetical protein